MYLWCHLLITDLLVLIQVSSSNVSVVSSIKYRSIGFDTGKWYQRIYGLIYWLQIYRVCTGKCYQLIYGFIYCLQIYWV